MIWQATGRAFLGAMILVGVVGSAGAELTIDPSRPDLVAAEGAYRRGHPAEAFRQFEVLANQGDVTGMSWVAFLYTRGEGVRQDYAAALEWYRKAAG
jgi:TPR repeat protein